jgi:lipoprotein-anchoring transpeptidase ErfK/SrfK
MAMSASAAALTGETLTAARQRAGGPMQKTTVFAGVAALALIAAGGVAAAAIASAPRPTVHAHAATPEPVAPAASLLVDGHALGAETLNALAWASPLQLTGVNGTVAAAVVTGPDGRLRGHATGGGWQSDAPLLPQAVYNITTDLISPAGKTSSIQTTVSTIPAATVLHATIGTGDSQTVGVGEPVVITFNHSLVTATQRRQVTSRLSVTATPAIAGAWHWMNDAEVHYRTALYWAAGTRLHVQADLTRLHLTGTRTWGSGRHTSDYRIGDALISTVDVIAHTMTVRRNGTVLRTLPVSTGRDKYPTKGGVHIVLDKQADQLFDSRTVGIPTASPDGYFEHLPWSVRISDGGAFVHANPATVQYQGVTNVSHGCVNLSVADAEWFYQQARLGDVVEVIHAKVGPLVSDPGMSDWNLSFREWGRTAYDL